MNYAPKTSENKGFLSCYQNKTAPDKINIAKPQIVRKFDNVTLDVSFFLKIRKFGISNFINIKFYKI